MKKMARTKSGKMGLLVLAAAIVCATNAHADDFGGFGGGMSFGSFSDFGSSSSAFQSIDYGYTPISFTDYSGSATSGGSFGANSSGYSSGYYGDYTGNYSVVPNYSYSGYSAPAPDYSYQNPTYDFSGINYGYDFNSAYGPLAVADGSASGNNFLGTPYSGYDSGSGVMVNSAVNSFSLGGNFVSADVFNGVTAMLADAENSRQTMPWAASNEGIQSAFADGVKKVRDFIEQNPGIVLDRMTGAAMVPQPRIVDISEAQANAYANAFADIYTGRVVLGTEQEKFAYTLNAMMNADGEMLTPAAPAVVQSGSSGTGAETSYANNFAAYVVGLNNFVVETYYELLARAPTASEEVGLLISLGTGETTASQVLANVSNSPEGIRKRVLLDPRVYNTAEYLRLNPDINAAYGFILNDAQAIEHWVTYGVSEGRQASLRYSTRQYLEMNADVAAAFGSNFEGMVEHYIYSGIPQGRAGVFALRSEVYDTAEYLRLNPDINAAYGFALNDSQAVDHWLNYGINEGRQARASFSTKEYLAMNLDVVAAFGPSNYAKTIEHFVNWGAPYGRVGVFALRPEIFNASWYLTNNPDIDAAYGFHLSEAQAQNHWLTYGIGEGRQAAQNFSSRDYLQLNLDVLLAVGAGNFKGSIAHYVQYGEYEGRQTVQPTCQVTLKSCPNHPDLANRTFADDNNGSGSNGASCQLRANDYASYCATTENVTTDFFKSGVKQVSQTTVPSECKVSIASCPNHPELANRTFGDGWGTDAGSCQSRANDYSSYCATSETVTTNFFKYGVQQASQTTPPSECKVTMKSCPNHPELANRTFPDDNNGSGSNAASCQVRANDYASYCASNDAVTTQFFQHGFVQASQTTPASECKVTLKSCPNHPEYANKTFNDDANNAGSVAMTCKARATDYASWCETDDSVTTQFFKSGAVQVTETTPALGTIKQVNLIVQELLF